MTAPNEYLQVMFPPPFEMCGLKLLPFSFGHWCILRAYNSPFVADETDPETDMSDLLGFLPIVCRTWEENVQFLRDDAAVNEWMKDYMDKWIAHCESTNTTIDWQKHIQEAADYVHAHRKSPLVADHGESISGDMSMPSAVSWEQDCLIKLIVEGGYKDRSEVFNAPLGQVYYDFFYLKDRAGQLTFLDQYLVEMIKANQPLTEVQREEVPCQV